MKIKYIIQGLLTVAFLLTGCNKNDGKTPEQQGVPINFEMDVKTKAIPTTSDNITDFGVYAYMTNYVDWDAALDATSNWIDHEQIVRQNDLWMGRYTFYWPVAPADKLTFFAYSPYANSYNGITVPKSAVIGEPSATGVPKIDFEISKDIPTQVDFLVAKPQYNKTNADAKNKVLLKFEHTTTKVGFKAFSPAPGTSLTSITLTNMPYKGSMLINENKWTLNSAVTNFEYYVNGVIVSADPANPTNLSEPSNYFLFFPKDFTTSSTSELVVVYSNPDGDEFTKKAPILEKWEEGKSITYTFELNAEKTEDLIVTSVKIIDWKFEDGGNKEGNTIGKFYRVTLDANGGTLTSGQSGFIKDYEYGEMPKIPTGNPTSPASGGTFKEWNTASDGSGTVYQPGTRIKVSGAITLYAIWTPVP